MKLCNYHQDNLAWDSCNGSDTEGCEVVEARQFERMRKALADIDLRATQARIASGIGKKRDRTSFLLGELERLQVVAREAVKP